MSGDVVVSLKEAHNDAVQLHPLDVMARIIEAIPDYAGLKDEKGHLLRTYPTSGKVSFFDQGKLWHDAATLAHIVVNSDVLESAIMSQILEAVCSLPAENPGAAFAEICSVCRNGWEGRQGRINDTLEAIHYNERREIVGKYAASLKGLGAAQAAPAPVKIEARPE